MRIRRPPRWRATAAARSCRSRCGLTYWPHSSIAIRKLPDAAVIERDQRIDPAVTVEVGPLVAEPQMDFDDPPADRLEVEHAGIVGQVPAKTKMSEALSKDLKQRGFNFCGPVIVYAFAQAVGMVNDHIVACPRHAACAALGNVQSALR